MVLSEVGVGIWAVHWAPEPCYILWEMLSLHRLCVLSNPPLAVSGEIPPVILHVLLGRGGEDFSFTSARKSSTCVSNPDLLLTHCGCGWIHPTRVWGATAWSRQLHTQVVWEKKCWPCQGANAMLVEQDFSLLESSVDMKASSPGVAKGAWGN